MDGATPPPDILARIAQGAARLSGDPQRKASVALDPERMQFAATRVFAIAAERHGPGVELIELDVSNSPRLRVVRSAGESRAELGAAPPSLETATRQLDTATAGRVLERIRVALAASATLDRVATSNDKVEVQPLTATSSNPWLSFVLSDASGRAFDRTFSAYLTTDTAPDYAPLAEAWNELTTLRPPLSATADAALSEVVVQAWKLEAKWPKWSTRRMLSLSLALPSEQLVPALMANLGAEAPLATLAVNALAAASGKDLRRDESGAWRTLPRIINDYRTAFRGRAE